MIAESQISKGLPPLSPSDEEDVNQVVFLGIVAGFFAGIVIGLLWFFFRSLALRDFALGTAAYFFIGFCVFRFLLDRCQNKAKLGEMTTAFLLPSAFCFWLFIGTMSFFIK